MKKDDVVRGEPKPGDQALHKSNQLDSRPVARVEGRLVWILIGDTEAGPYPRENYTYHRTLRDKS
ncbi:MAG TPA: hypothetical protein VIM47_01025 [Dermatophilaceae bacterium]